jgi:hypothetical protein
MLKKYNQSIRYLIIFLVAFPASIIVTRPLVASTDKFIFLSIFLTISLLVFWKPKKIFLFSVGGAVLFYDTFLQKTLFYLGNSKVYAQDMLIAAMTIYLVFQLLCKYRRDLFKSKSTIFFVLYFLWGILSIARGYPRYGFSAIGESRWYVLIILFYFFVLISFHQKKDALLFLKWMPIFVAIMIIKNFTIFFFLNSDMERIGRTAFRFIYSTETLLIAFLLVFLLLISLNRQVKISSLRINFISFLLLSIIVVVQIRSVWLATAGGLFATYILSKKKMLKVLISIGLTIFLLFTFAPFVSKFVGVNLYKALKNSAIFLQSPEKDSTASWRLTAWKQELKRTKEYPIIGGSLGGYSEWFDGQHWQRVMVHNGYIMIFSKLGIVGIFLLFSGIFFWYKEMNQYVRNENDFYYKMIGIALQISVFMHLIYVAFYDFTVFFWILIGLGSVLFSSIRNDYWGSLKIMRTNK